MKKITGKRFVAAIVSVAMMSSCIPMAFAEDGAGDEELVNELLSYSEEYPDGAFAFLDSQLEANEDDGEIYIDVVRYGSFEGDASVSFKAIDVSATYGKDYTLSVGDGWFLSRKLEQDEDAMPLMELYTDTSSEYTIGEEAENEEADDEEQVIQMAIDGESGELLVADNSAEPEEKAPATGLRAARNTYIGNESDRKSWQEITGADSEKAAEAQSDMENVPDYIGEFADGLPGTEHVLHFSDGEYKKRVKINLIDDDVSETDEQVMFIVYDSEGADIAKPQSAYLNIIDTDENEPVVFYIDNESVTVTPDDDYASVTVKRDSGIEKFATVTVGTGAIDAQPDVDYKSGSVEVVFPQGVTERTVKIPVYNAMRSEEVSFAVAIDKETAFVDENRYGTLVTVEPRVSEEEMELYSEASEITSEEGDNTRSFQLMSANHGTWMPDGKELYLPNRYQDWYVLSPRYLSAQYCDYEAVIENLDLRNAVNIEISYVLRGTTPFDKLFFGEHGWYKTNQMDKQGQIKIGSKVVTVTTTQDEAKGTVTITDFPKKKDQSLEIQVRKIRCEEGYAELEISQVIIQYYDITVSIDNTTYDTNRYTEKIYAAGNSSTNQGLGCENGNTMKLGDGFFGGSSTVKTVRSFSDPVNFTVKGVSGQKTSQGIAPEVGRNVYIAGWQFYDYNHNKYLDNIISVDDMSMEAIYSYAVKSKQADRRAFMVRPVLKPYPSMIRFNNSWKDLLAYTNNISDGKEISATMLDTINLEGVPVKNSGKAVDKFLINGYLDKDAHMKSGSARANRIAELEKASKSEGDRTAYLNSHKNATDEVSVDSNSADSSKVVLTPDCEAVYVDMAYTTPKIDVKYNPSRAAVTQYKDMGKVVYVNQETETALDGDYNSTMTIQPVDYGHVFNMNALYTDTDESKYISDYKTIWQDFTGDLDGDGELSTSEVEALSRYNLDRAPSTGDTFDYKPRVTNSLIYYQFVRREKVQGAGGIYGIVLLKDYPVFEGKTKYKPLNGATVIVDGHTGVTNYDADFGGEKGTGGDGYFSFRDNTFVAGESHRVNVEYGPLSTSAVHHVNVAQTYILDSYDTISVISASRAKNGNTMKSMKTEPMLNDDASYTLTFNTKSSISAKVATKAKLTFYRKDKTIITTQEYESTGENTGVFDCTFNPKTLGIPAGASITVQFIDNDGVAYFEHDTGLYFMQSLGMLSLMSSFSGGANSAFQVIGQIGMLFGFGWDGNLDDDKGKVDDELLDFVDYSISTTGEKKVLKLNIKFDTKGKIEGDKKKDDKKDDKQDDKADSADKDALKEAAKSNDNSKVKEAAKKADGGKKKSEGKLTNSYKLKFTFGLELDLKAADDPQHKGEWAFGEFLIVINAEGSLSFSTTYVTPIGVPITFGLTVGAEGEAIFVVESRLGTSYYMTDLLGDNSGTVDMLKKGHSLDEYMYTYGKFRIKPYIDISVTVGWTGFKAWLDGHAEMNFSYNMKDEKFEGSVSFNCTLSIKIIFFTKSWTLVDKTISLFSAGPELYNSLDEFEVSDRENLKYRTAWNGGGGIRLMSVADLSETDLMGGVNPDTDTKLMPLGDGKYIAVFVDDVPERDENNSLGIFYTIYNGSEWSEPKMIEDDGTTDDSPAVQDVGDGRLFIAWSSANEVFNEEPGVLETLNSRNIHGVFFDKETQEIGNVIEVTKNTTADYAGDVNPRIAYNDTTKRMIIYYTKEEYTASENSEEGVYGDAVYPYSVIAYRIYDVANDKFIDYTDEEKDAIKAELATGGLTDNNALDTYTENYYNQRFPNLAPVSVGVNGANESNGSNDPLVIESDAIAYDDCALFAYIIDNDSAKNSTYDQDIYMQIYDFKDNSLSYPIRLTSNSNDVDVEEEIANAQEDGTVQTDTASKIHFERIGGADGSIYLAYLCNGEIRMMNISDNISDSNVFKESDIDGVKYYVIDKNADSYISEETLIGEYASGDYTGEIKITDYDLRSNDKYFYVMFNESKTRPKDGIEDGSEEAAQIENRVAESHIYMKRYDLKNNLFTNPVQVTEDEGMNYDNIAFAVEDSGFVAMATRCASKLETVNGSEVLAADKDNSTLCVINFKPDASVELRKGAIENIVSDSDVYASFEVYNGGIETIDGLTVEITDGHGNKLEPVYDSEDSTVSLIGGNYQTVSMSLPVAADENSAEFTAKVKDSKGKVLDEISVSDTVARKLDVASFDAEITERGKVTFDAVLVNNETVSSGERTFQIVTDDDTVLFETDIDSLMPEEYITVSDTIDIDYDELFNAKVNENGSIDADLNLTATAGSVDLSETISLYATADQMARFNAVKSVTFGAGTKVTVAEDGVLNLEPTITAGEYKGGRIDDNNESEIDAQGVELMYVSSDEDIVKVYSNGYIVGESKGTATVTAMLIPSDVTYDGTDYTSRYATLPDEAIKTYTIDVTVGDAEPTPKPRSGGGGGGGTSTYKVNVDSAKYNSASSNGSVSVSKSSAKEGDTVTITVTPNDGYEVENVIVKDKDGNEITVTKNADGTYSYVQPKGQVTVDAEFKELTDNPAVNDDWWFTDVPESAWYYEPIKAAYDNGLMSGVSDNEFAPETDITRGMFVTVLHRIDGEPERDGDYGFTDVPENAYYADAVAWGSANGIIAGYSDTEFAPDDKITREQMAAILWRYAKYKDADVSVGEDTNILSYTDATDISEYAIPAIQWVCGAGIITGFEDNTLRPKDNTTRAQAAVVFGKIDDIIKRRTTR